MTQPLRILVCGGRDYQDRAKVFATLLTLHVHRRRIATIIEGGATGADALARVFCQHKPEIEHLSFPADWDDIERPGARIKYRRDGRPYDALAGFVRNQRMLDEGKPNLVVAFPGGNGTADMVLRARRAGVEVMEVTP